MSARDRYKWVLECLDCGKAGEAEVSENDGWSFMKGSVGRSVDKITQGFIVVEHGAGRDGTATTHACECGGTSGVTTSSP